MTSSSIYKLERSQKTAVCMSVSLSISSFSSNINFTIVFVIFFFLFLLVAIAISGHIISCIIFPLSRQFDCFHLHPHINNISVSSFKPASVSFSFTIDPRSCLKLYNLVARPLGSLKLLHPLALSLNVETTDGLCFCLSSCSRSSVMVKKPIQAVKTSWLLSNVEPVSVCNKVITSPASFVVTRAGPVDQTLI